MTKLFTLNNSWLCWLGLLGLDLISFISYSALYSNWAAVLVVIAFTIVALRSFPAALVLMVVELVVGSQGYWFTFEFAETVISLRLAIFFVVMAVFLYQEVGRRDLTWLRAPIVKWWSLGVLAIVWGSVVGWLNNDFANWFLDLNGYLYIFIFLPLYRHRHEWIPKLLSVWLPVVLYLSFKTIMLFYLYSHFTPEALDPIYHWVRNTGWGEITYAGGNVFRIFSQSQIYLLIGATLFLSGLLFNDGAGPWYNKFRISNVMAAIIIVTALIISLSRSFWLGGMVAILFALFLLILQYRNKVQQKLLNFSLVLLALLAASGLVFTVSGFPLPKPLAAETGFLLNRASVGAGDAAGASRLQLLHPLWGQVTNNWLIGTGFGTTVAYKTSDPRIVQGTAGGEAIYTTYAFEWGYLDIWLKLGLIGLLLYMWWWLRLSLWALSVAKFNKFLVFILAGVVSVATANMTTPYLNHPLGIGALTVLFLIIYSEHNVQRLQI